jgi:hypothetical protein
MVKRILTLACVGIIVVVLVEIISRSAGFKINSFVEGGIIGVIIGCIVGLAGFRFKGKK